VLGGAVVRQGGGIVEEQDGEQEDGEAEESHEPTGGEKRWPSLLATG
jgi:hypothetical protein